MNQIVGMADALLDDTARRLAASADDLLIRAGVAADDSSAAERGAGGPVRSVVGSWSGVVAGLGTPSRGGGFVVGGGSYGTPIDSRFGGGGPCRAAGPSGTPQPALLSTGGSAGAFGVSEASLGGRAVPRLGGGATVIFARRAGPRGAAWTRALRSPTRTETAVALLRGRGPHEHGGLSWVGTSEGRHRGPLWTAGAHRGVPGVGHPVGEPVERDPVARECHSGADQMPG